MLSYDTFEVQFCDLLGDRFGKKFSHALTAMYFTEFQKYSDETFTEICRLAFCEDFLPSPKWFQEQSVCIAARSLGDLIPRLPSAQELELNSLTETQRIENIKRITAMMKASVKTIGGGKE